MSRLLDLLIGCVATWRLSHLFLVENGPYRMLRRIRERFGVVYESDDSNAVTSYKYEITMCPWCISIWVGTGVTIALSLPRWGRSMLLPFVFSAGSIWLGRINDIQKVKRDVAEEFQEFRVN